VIPAGPGPSLRIVFFGLPLGALLLAHDGHEIALAAISRADGVGLRRLRRLCGADRVRLKSDVAEASFLARVRSLEPDLLVSWFWTTRLPMSLVRAARLGGIGVHPSLLPRHRGPDPTSWAIASGDPETGVTVHRLEVDYDTGAILAQARLTIDPTWNAWNLARALDRPSLRLLRETVRRLARGEVLAEVPQDESAATAAPFVEDEATWIEWSWPTERVLRHVRALAPAPGAETEIGGVRVTVLRAAAASSFPSVLVPGEGAVVDGSPLVRTGDGAIVLLEGVIHEDPAGADGGEDRLAGAAELAALFLSGLRLVVG